MPQGLPGISWHDYQRCTFACFRKYSVIDDLLTIESSKKHITSSYLSKFFVNKKLINKPFHQKFLLKTSAKILVVIIMMIDHESVVSGFSEQPVERRGSSVFCKAKVPKSNARECSRWSE